MGRFEVAAFRRLMTIWQGLGMWGLMQTARRTLGWTLRLRLGRIVRKSSPPTSQFPMRSFSGEAASHALPGIVLKQRASSMEQILPETNGAKHELPILSSV